MTPPSSPVTADGETAGLHGLVYFSSVSKNTHRFVERLDPASLDMPPHRIPLRPGAGILKVTQPYVLVVPTYGGGNQGGAVPKQVVKFLNDPENRAGIRGVIAAGNTNFGEAYCLAGKVISTKCQVPYLYGFELLGTDQDLMRVREGLLRMRSTDHTPIHPR